MHDPLTGLPNRVYLLDRVDRAIAQLRRDPSRPFALLYIDVDRFKQINDNLGHLAGDDVLCEVATRLKDIVREPDVVARLSGDEFAVLLERLEASGDASHVARSEEHTSELQSLMRISYAVFCLKKKKPQKQ